MSDRDRVDMSTCHWFLLLVVVMHLKLLDLSDIGNDHNTVWSNSDTRR